MVLKQTISQKKVSPDPLKMLPSLSLLRDLHIYRYIYPEAYLCDKCCNGNPLLTVPS